MGASMMTWGKHAAVRGPMKPLLRSMLAISVSSFVLLVCSTVLVTRASSSFTGAVFGSLAVAVLVSVSAWALFIRPKLRALQQLASGICEFANRKFSTRLGPEGERALGELASRFDAI